MKRQISRTKVKMPSNFDSFIAMPLNKRREVLECEDCKNSCIGKFVDDELKDCVNFIPKRISAEEKYLKLMFGTK